MILTIFQCSVVSFFIYIEFSAEALRGNFKKKMSKL